MTTSGPDLTGPQHLMNKEELARFLGVSVAWVRKGVANRTLPYTNVGRLVRFTPEQVAQILASGDRPALNPTAMPATGKGSARTPL